MTAIPRFAAITVAVSVATLLILFACNLLLTYPDRNIYRERATDALSSGVLISRSGYPFVSTDRPYRYGVNDCLILSMLSLPGSASRVQRAISPEVPDFGAIKSPPEFVPPGVDQARREPTAVALKRQTPPARECFVLKKTLAQQPPRTEPYHRYIHGYVTLAAALLLPFGYASATAILWGLAVAIPIILIALAWLSKSPVVGPPDRRLAYGAMALAYLIFSGVSYYAWEIDLAPAELLLGVALLVAFLRPISGLTPTRLWTIAAVFGALCLSFDFLRGLLPSALSLLIGLFAVEQPQGGGSELKRAALAVGAFCSAVFVTFAVKALVVMLIWPAGEVSGAGRQLLLHMSSGTWEINAAGADTLAKVGVSVEAIKASRFLSFFYALAKLAYFSDLLTFGLRPLGLVAVVVGPALLLAIAVARTFKPSASLSRPAAMLLLASLAVPLLWIFVFVEHAIDTPAVMQRILAWPTIILCGTVVRQIAARRTA